ncbi:MAG: putative extracytoplasmic binding receptor, partial [Pseudomonadota bacterium]
TFLPELPTVIEAGLPGYTFDSWIGLLAPAGTPKAEIDRIHAAVQKAMAEPTVKERLLRLGVEYTPMSPADFQKLLQADWDNAAQIVKTSGAKVD